MHDSRLWVSSVKNLFHEQVWAYQVQSTLQNKKVKSAHQHAVAREALRIGKRCLMCMHGDKRSLRAIWSDQAKFIHQLAVNSTR